MKQMITNTCVLEEREGGGGGRSGGGGKKERQIDRTDRKRDRVEKEIGSDRFNDGVLYVLNFKAEKR